MNIDEQIAKFRGLAKEIRGNIYEDENLEPYERYANKECYEMAQDNEQIANWLERYKYLCELVRWETVRDYSTRVCRISLEYDDRLSADAVMAIIYSQIKDKEERNKYGTFN